MQSLWHRLERFSVTITPAALTVLLVLLSAVPLHIPGASQIMPAVALICIYFWNSFAPGLLPFAFLFVLGMLEDTLFGLPLCVSSAANILFALLLLREHRNFAHAQFGAVWLGFTVLSFVTLALKWVIMSFYMGLILPAGADLLQWIATCFAYPPMHLLLTRIWRALMAS